MISNKKFQILLLLCICLLLSGSAAAKTFTVSSRYDLPDLTPGDGKCVAYLIIIPPFVIAFCTLRAAIEEANSFPGDDEILLGSGTHLLEIEGAGEDLAATGDLDITDSVIVTGAGREETVIDGGGLDRIFDVHGKNTLVSVQNMSLRNGVVASRPDDVNQGGGGIRNFGDLTFSGVLITENRVEGEGSDSGGGALYNQGKCRVIRSSVTFNEAAAGGGIWSGEAAALAVNAATVRNNDSPVGGGIYNLGWASLLNATISSNGGTDASAQALGVYNRGRMEIVQSTIAENNSGGPGVGLLNEGDVTMVNTVVASHAKGDCILAAGSLDSQGGNLDSDGSCGLGRETDFSGFEPMLSGLGSWGGPTWSYLFSLGSPLRDHGVDLSGWGVVSDQRGKVRPRGKGYDIGAVERQFSAALPAVLPLLL